MIIYQAEEKRRKEPKINMKVKARLEKEHLRVEPNSKKHNSLEEFLP